MLPLLAPILAQLVTLNVGDRTEGRYVTGQSATNQAAYFAAETRPSIGLGLRLKHSDVSLFYTPLIFARPGTDTDDKELLVFNTVSFGSSYRERRTSYDVNASAGYGKRDFGVELLGAPKTPLTPGGTGGTPTAGIPPGGTPTGGTTNGGTTTGGTTNGGTTNATALSRASNGTVRYGSFFASVGVTNQVSRQLTLHGDVGYAIFGGTDPQAQALFPLQRGPRFLLSANQTLNRQDNLASSLTGQYVSSEATTLFPKTDSWLLIASENWGHLLAARTNVRVGTGLAFGRFAQSNGLIGYSIYPSLNAGYDQAFAVASGTLAYTFSTATTPTIDPTTGVIDPRFSLGTGLGWAGRRFSMGAYVNTTLSLARTNQQQGALNYVGVSARMSYLLGRALSVDTGVRGAAQTYNGQRVVAPASAVFVGVSINADTVLVR